MMKENKVIELTPLEHIKTRPGMYIGGTSVKEEEKLLFDPETKTFKYTKIKYVPGLLKIINEIFDNSFDEFIRTDGKYANKIEVEIDSNSIMIKDNGRGVPQTLTKDGTPEVVVAFTKPFSGTNFSSGTKAEDSIGMNGVGSVATNVFSSFFRVVTNDGKDELTLTCTNNVDEIKWGKKPSKRKTGTIVDFTPDFSLFEVDSLSEVYVTLIRNRMIHLSQQFDIEFVLKHSINNEDNIEELF